MEYGEEEQVEGEFDIVQVSVSLLTNIIYHKKIFPYMSMVKVKRISIKM